MIDTRARAAEIVEKLLAADIPATCDPTAAVPPVVLVTMPSLAFDLNWAADVTWSVLCLAVGPGNLDAWPVLQALAAGVIDQFPVVTGRPVRYPAADGVTFLPAYLLTFTEALDDD